MIHTRLVSDVALTELALGLVIIAVVLSVTAWHHTRHRRQVERFTRARTEVVDALLKDRDPDWKRIPQAEVSAVLQALAASADGTTFDRLQGWAADLGILADAHQQVRHPRSRSARKGLRTLALFRAGDAVAAARLAVSPRRDVRTDVLLWIARTHADSELPILLDALEDPAAEVRFWAADGLVRSRGKAAALVLQRCLSPAASESLIAVAEAVADASFYDLAMEWMSRTDDRLRVAGIRILSQIPDARNSLTLSGLLKDPSVDVRIAAMRAASRLAIWESAASIVDRMSAPQWRERRAAGQALWEFGALGQLVLQRAANSGDGFARDMARYFLNVDMPGHQRQNDDTAERGGSRDSGD